MHRHDIEYLWHKIASNQITTAKGVLSCERFGILVLQDPTESLISAQSQDVTVSASDFLSFWYGNAVYHLIQSRNVLMFHF